MICITMQNMHISVSLLDNNLHYITSVSISSNDSYSGDGSVFILLEKLCILQTINTRVSVYAHTFAIYCKSINQHYKLKIDFHESND